MLSIIFYFFLSKILRVPEMVIQRKPHNEGSTKDSVLRLCSSFLMSVEAGVQKIHEEEGFVCLMGNLLHIFFRRISFTIAGFACPFVSFITQPTTAPRAAVLPAL